MSADLQRTVRQAEFVRDKWPSMALIVISGEPGDGYTMTPSGAFFCAKPLPDALPVSSVGVALAASLRREEGEQAGQCIARSGMVTPTD